MYARIVPILFVTFALTAVGCDDDTVSLDESGELVVEDLEVGTGETAETGDRLAVHAVGKLEDGDVFFDSYPAEQPLFWELGDPVVLEGWTRGLPGMKLGGTRRLVIPPRLAYGLNPPQGIPQNATITFDVELVDVNHPDSLSVIDLVEGDGAEVARGDSLSVRYVGKLADGRTFDETQQGQSFSFRLEEGGLIDGWIVGLEGVKVGGTRRLIIPPELGYGGRQRGSIPPNSTLLFDVEIVEVFDEAP